MSVKVYYLQEHGNNIYSQKASNKFGQALWAEKGGELNKWNGENIGDITICALIFCFTL